MDKKSTRLKKAYSGKGFRAFIILCSIAIISPIAMIIVYDYIFKEDILDTDIRSIILMIVFFVVLLAVITSLIVGIVLLFIGNKKDKKVYGTGPWFAQFNALLNSDKKSEIFIFLQGKGFLLDEQKDMVCFIKTTDRCGGKYKARIVDVYHINIVYSDEMIKIEAFFTSTQSWFRSNETGLYGSAVPLVKYRLRKIIANVLDILEAPQDITV